MRVAVIGGGISGLTAAYLLRDLHDVVLFESENRLGGHAHTHQLAASSAIERPNPMTADANGHIATDSLGVDSGFIVHNHETYPNLLRLFAELNVQTQPAEMSMSISCNGCGLEYAGGRGLSGILAQPRRILDRRFLQLLGEVKRFHREARATLAANEDDLTAFGEWLTKRHFSDYFVHHFAVPLVACVWSSGQGNALNYPAAYLFPFLNNHGMLSVKGSPQWYTVTGGSAQYVEKIAAQLPVVDLGEPVLEVRRSPSVMVRTPSGEWEFDHVILATHADLALNLLRDANPLEREILGAFAYTSNTTVLHTDSAILPRNIRARASWNYRMTSCNAHDDAPSVTYWMNKLQRLPAHPEYLVTLNDVDGIQASAQVARMHYAHPLYTSESVSAQRRIDEISTEKTSFAGAHLGWGFHEDGCRSGVEAARRLGSTW